MGLGCFPFDNETYLTLSDSRLSLSGILSLIGFSNLSAPSPFSALPPVMSKIEASPKAISERTSYLRVRLEFLRYPQFITGLFNGRVFGPPWSFTSTSAWSWLGHLVSGLWQLTSFALLTLGFPSPPVLNTLSLPVTITRRTVLQKVRHHPLTGYVCL